MIDDKINHQRNLSFFHLMGKWSLGRFPSWQRKT